MDLVSYKSDNEKINEENTHDILRNSKSNINYSTVEIVEALDVNTL
jgi:hypothetical protein